MSATSPVITLPIAADAAALETLISPLLARFGNSVRGILLYGSCLRSGDFYDGLVDLYLVVDDYGRAYGNWRLALGNRLLAPNVFYTEEEHGGSKVRSKYAVVSVRDIARATSRRRFESYFWGRFAQPVAIVYSCDSSDREFLQGILNNAHRTFLDRTLPALAPQGTVDELWQQAMALSYSTELRSERPGRARELLLGNHAFFMQVTERWASALPHRLRLYSHDGVRYYQSTYSGWQRKFAAVGWKVRRLWGKVLSLCRLIKALFTFDGGLDYIAWKLERHSGQRVVIPDKVRRRPLIHIWGLFWRLYRRGVFK